VTVKLYQFPPLWGVSSPSPACVAVETYLRMAAVPFESVPTRNAGKGPRSKLPVIDDDGTIVTDLEAIFAHLKARHGDPLDARLTEVQRAHLLLLRRTFEEHLYWVGIYLRWIDDAGWRAVRAPYSAPLPLLARLLLPPLVRAGMRLAMFVQGMGRHGRDEVYARGRADLSAAAALLGDAPYFGGEAPCSFDAVAYGFMANLLWVPIESPLLDHARALPTLVAHAERIRERHYPAPVEARAR